MRILAALILCAPAALAADLAGKVVEDHTGNPLASVSVRVYKTGQRLLAADLETDTAGQFSASGLPDGEYRIEAAKPNYLGATLRLQSAAPGLVIRLVRCGVIAGQVLDAQGQPILGASVYALAKPPDGGPLRVFNPLIPGTYARIDERGQYRLHGLPPGEYAVAVGYGASTMTFGSMGGAEVRPGLGSGVQMYPNNTRPQLFPVAGGEQYRNIDFAVAPSAMYNLAGKVDLPDPKSHYWLALIAADQPTLAIAVADTKPDGTFLFEGVPGGSYTLSASGPVRGYGGKAVLGPDPYFGRMPVSLAANVDGVAMAVRKARSASFILRIAGAGPCPAAAPITATAIDDFAARIDREGQVTAAKETVLASLAPARYRITARDLGELCYQSTDVTVDLTAAAADAPVPIPVAAAGAIHGKLTGTPKPAAFAIALASADPESTAPVQVVFPAADGRFIFGGLRPGRYWIAAQPADAGPQARWVTTAAKRIEIQIAGGSPTEMDLPALVGQAVPSARQGGRK